MKKASVFVLVVLSIATGLFAQDKGDKNSKVFSLCGSIAYGFGVGGQHIDSSLKVDGATILEKSDKYLNYGDGFKVELGGIYKLMENLDVQGMLMYNFGTPEIQAIHENAGETATNTYYAGTFGIKVLALPKIKILDLLDMYTGFGVGLYFASLSWTNSETPTEGNYTTAPALGFCGSIGINYPVYNDLIVYGEIAVEAMSFTVTSVFNPEIDKKLFFEQDSQANNIWSPAKIPGSNVAFRVGAKFPVF
ncbi:MAG: hypothetical protein WBM07_11285 [Chitinivibrionales bacterium]